MKRAIYTCLAVTVMVVLTGCLSAHGRRPTACMQGSCAQRRRTAPLVVHVRMGTAKTQAGRLYAADVAVTGAIYAAAVIAMAAMEAMEAKVLILDHPPERLHIRTIPHAARAIF